MKLNVMAGNLMKHLFFLRVPLDLSHRVSYIRTSEVLKRILILNHLATSLSIEIFNRMKNILKSQQKLCLFFILRYGTVMF